MESTEEIMTFYGRCRCCLDYGYMMSMWKEHIWDDEREIYGEMLMETFNVVWDSNSKDEHICEPCVTRLRDAYHFKKEVLASELMLQEDLEEDYFEANNLHCKDEILSDEEEDEEEYILPELVNTEGEEDSKDFEEPKPAEYGEIEFLEEDAEIVEQSVSTLDRETDSDGALKRKLPRKKKKNERTGYRQYSQADLKRCVELLQQSEGLSQSQAARMFNIPTKTVNAKMRSLTKTNDDESETKEGQKTEITKHRDNIQTVLKNTNATPIKGHRGIGYMCHFCPKQYAKAADLKTHTYTHKDIWKKFKVPLVFSHTVKLDITGLKCKICHSDIDELSLEDAMEHLKFHGKIIHTDIKNHIIPFKFDNLSLQCVKCDESFSYFKLLSAHMSKHYPNYRCKECGKGFINKHSRRTHMSRHNIGEFTCNICEKTFSTKSKMKDHERVVHILRNKTQRCSYCSERFVDVVQKSNHEVSAHGAEAKKFICQYCDKVYESQRSVTAHVKRIHLMLKPHKCHFCEKCFFKKSSLMNHLVTHTGEKKYECSFCSKTFGTRSSLVKHRQTHVHVSEKEFLCFDCGKTFPLLSEFQSHLREDVQGKESVFLYEIEEL